MRIRPAIEIADRKTQLAADLVELRQVLQGARSDLKTLPAPNARNATQRNTARSRRFELLVGRILLNALSTPTDDDMDQNGATG